MKKMLKKNWPAKIATLIVAVVIWFLIDYIVTNENPGANQPGVMDTRD